MRNISNKNDSKQKDGRLFTFIIPAIVIIIVFTSILWWIGRCDGEQKWSEHTGVLKEIYIECDICCHVQSGFNIDGKWYPVLNCQKSLEDIPLNQTYTFYLKPDSESYAISRPIGECNCFWSQSIYKIVDSHNNEVWHD